MTLCIALIIHSQGDTSLFSTRCPEQGVPSTGIIGNNVPMLKKNLLPRTV